jgi:hypothetical protein
MSIASILIDALKDKLTEYEKTELLTGFADLESASQETIVRRTVVTMGTLTFGDQEGITITHPSGSRAIVLEPEGNAFFGSDVDTPAKTSLSIFSEAKLYNQENFGAGDVLLGDNSAARANLFWDASEGRLNFRGGTDTYVYIDTDGSIVAQAGTIGGWSITSTQIKKTGIILDSAADQIKVGSSSPQILIDGATKAVKSSNYSADAAGFAIFAADGDAEFNNIVARGAFRTAVFTYQNISAVGGAILLTKNAGEVYEDVTTAENFTLKVKTADDGTTELFENLDAIRVKAWNGTEIIDIWGYLYAAPSTSGGVTSCPIELMSGGTGKVIQKGMAVVNYGGTGSGLMQLEAGEETTRLRIATHAGAPWTTQTNKVVLGNMRGTYGTGANDRYGIGIGDYSGGNYLSYNAKVADQFILKAGGGAVAISGSGIRIEDNESTERSFGNMMIVVLPEILVEFTETIHQVYMGIRPSMPQGMPPHRGTMLIFLWRFGMMRTHWMPESICGLTHPTLMLL